MIPYTSFGGHGAHLHFLHANGYPPACYVPLLKQFLNTNQICAMLMRPLWPDAKPNSINSWQPLSDDFLQYLNEQQGEPIIAVGHSLGSMVALRAALQQPNYFTALVLIEPVLFQPLFIAFWNLIKSMGLGYKLHPLISGATKRRKQFDDLEKLFIAYRKKKIFRYFSDYSLRTYISGITKQKKGSGFELVYPPEWEAHIYYTGVWRDLDIWHKLPSLKIPILIIRGAETDTFMSTTAAQVKRLRPSTTIITIEKSTHLVPLEKPRETYEIIQGFLKEDL